MKKMARPTPGEAHARSLFTYSPQLSPQLSEKVKVNMKNKRSQKVKWIRKWRDPLRARPMRGHCSRICHNCRRSYLSRSNKGQGQKIAKGQIYKKNARPTPGDAHVRSLFTFSAQLSPQLYEKVTLSLSQKKGQKEGQKVPKSDKSQRNKNIKFDCKVIFKILLVHVYIITIIILFNVSNLGHLFSVIVIGLHKLFLRFSIFYGIKAGWITFTAQILLKLAECIKRYVKLFLY